MYQVLATSSSVIDCRLGLVSLHCYALPTAAQVQVVTIFQHIALPRVLSIQQFFLLTAAVILDL